MFTIKVNFSGNARPTYTLLSSTWPLLTCSRASIAVHNARMLHLNNSAGKDYQSPLFFKFV